MTLREDCQDVIRRLQLCDQTKWAELWVNEKIRFHRTHCMGYLFSILHGTEFFSNILKCLDGMEWEPKNKGEYEENFRKFIKQHRVKP